jgi:hypothetical protein
MCCYNAAMKRPFQFSLRTMMGVMGLICVVVWWLAQVYHSYPADNPKANLIFVVAETIIVLLGWL